MTRALPCPVCGGFAHDEVVLVRAMPTVVCQFTRSRRAAFDIERGDLDIVACRRCSHVFNRGFEAGRVAYAQGYENSLGFSRHHRVHRESTIASLIERYDLRGKTILEIGSGSGDFLRSICANGGNRGIGYDPSHEGEVRIRQRKTNVERQVPLLPESLEELRSVAMTSMGHVIISEETGRPYTESNFQHRIADVFEAAGLGGRNVPPERRKVYGDLRRSAVVRMTAAECKPGLIASVTGHSLASVVRIMAIYSPPTTLAARKAQAKVAAFNSRRR